MIVEAPSNKKENISELTEEEKQINNEIDIFMSKIRTGSDQDKIEGINDLKKLLKDSTSSMTSVPKPLKFVSQYLAEIENFYNSLSDSSVFKKSLSDLISVIAMLNEENNFEKVFNYCLSGTMNNITSWGHEYVKHICYSVTKNRRAPIDESDPYYYPMKQLFDEIGPFLLSHNAETEICDILAEISHIEWITSYIDENNYKRICLYLEACLRYSSKKEIENDIRVLLDIYLKFNDFLPALRLSVKYNLVHQVRRCFESVDDMKIKIQMAFFLSSARFNDPSVVSDPGKDTLIEIMGNNNFSQYFIRMARDLDVMQVKTPEDVFKCGSTQKLIANDRIKGQLAATFVNGFVHAGFKTDYGISTEGSGWIYSNNKSNGLLSATASIGLINLWDVDVGLGEIDKYLNAEDEVKAGAYLACGIMCCGQAHECEPTIALLSEATKDEKLTCRYTAIMGLGIAYSGTNNEQVISILTEALTTEPITPSLIGYACYSIGLVAVGSLNSALVLKMITSIQNIDDDKWENEFGLINAFLGIGFVEFGLSDFNEQERIKCLITSSCSESLIQVGLSVLDMFYDEENGLSFSIENLLSNIGNNIESYVEAMIDTSHEKNTWANDLTMYKNGIEVISLAVKCCHDDISIQMMTRMLDHIMRFGEGGEKRAVPLALSLLYVSNPNVAIVETLAKYSHDLDQDVVISSILGMGIVGAGTNNARLSSQLRNLALHTVSTKNNNFQYTIRLAQSLLYMGKGTLTLSPFTSGKFIQKKAAIVSIIGFLISFLDSNKAILGVLSHHFYMIVPAISPRMLVTYNENLEPINVMVRVGQAVDLAGQTGNQRSITGFQTHNTPVMLSHGEQAELATNEYISLTPYLEGIVILKPNPNYVPS